MKIATYLSFNGDCRAAFEFYEKALRGKIGSMMTWGESPMADQTSADNRGRIMHASLEAAGNLLMGSDVPPEKPTKPHGFAVAVNLSDQAEAERIFAALSDGATIQMPLTETFFAVRFGMLVDKFGIPWMLNCEKPMQA